MSARDQPGAVVVGGSITGLNAVRALAGLEIPIAVVVTGADDIAQHSRWTTEFHELRDFSAQPDSLLDLLEHRTRRWEGRVILPAGDEAAALVSRHRERLERSYRVTVPPWEITRVLLNKDLTFAAAAKVGIDVPRVYGDATAALAARDDALSFPVVVKPVESRPFVRRFGVKLFVARDRAELRRLVGDLDAAGLRAQVLDLVPGPDPLNYSQSMYLDRHGQAVAALPTRRLRKSPPFFGVTRVGEIADVEAMQEPTLELLRHIGWHGMVSAEWKLDPRDGRFRLMELNGRAFLTVGLIRRAGVNHPLLAWQDAVDGDLVKPVPNGWNGVWINVPDDLYYALFFRRTVERLGLREYLAPYRRPKMYSVWSASDPVPFLAQCRLMAARAARAARDPRYRAILRRRVQRMPPMPGPSGD